MTIEAITERQKVESQVFDVARQIRALLDTAEKLELPDGRDGGGVGAGDGGVSCAPLPSRRVVKAGSLAG